MAPSKPTKKPRTGPRPERRGLWLAAGLGVCLLVGGLYLLSTNSDPLVVDAQAMTHPGAQRSSALLGRIIAHETAPPPGAHNVATRGDLDMTDSNTLQLADDMLVGVPSEIGTHGFTLSGRRIVLWGVLAPKPGLSCRSAKGAWDCAAAAQQSLTAFLTEHQLVACVPMDVDAAGRTVARCAVGELDVGYWALVSKGLALNDAAVTDAYAFGEAFASTREDGAWSGSTPPDRDLFGR